MLAVTSVQTAFAIGIFRGTPQQCSSPLRCQRLNWSRARQADAIPRRRPTVFVRIRRGLPSDHLIGVWWKDVTGLLAAERAIDGRHAARCALGASSSRRRDRTLIEDIQHIVGDERHSARRLVYLSFLGVQERRKQLSFIGSSRVLCKDMVNRLRARAHGRAFAMQPTGRMCRPGFTSCVTRSART